MGLGMKSSAFGEGNNGRNQALAALLSKKRRNWQRLKGGDGVVHVLKLGDDHQTTYWLSSNSLKIYAKKFWLNFNYKYARQTEADKSHKALTVQ